MGTRYLKGKKQMIARIINYINRKTFERYLREAETAQRVEKHIRAKL